MTNLAICTIKKTGNVFRKIGVAVIKCIVACLLFAILYLVVVYGAIPCVIGIYGYIINAPWWLMLIIMPILTVISAIITYSYSWCLARELKENDWKDDIVTENMNALSSFFAFAFALAAFAFALAAFAFALAAVAFVAPPSFFAFAFALAAVAANNNNYGKWYYFAIRFVFVYYEHEKRIKCETKE